MRTARCVGHRRGLLLGTWACFVICMKTVFADQPAADERYGLPLEGEAPMHGPQEEFASRIVGLEAGWAAIVSVCGESFPPYKASNEAAFKAWRTAHQRSLSEAERIYSAAVLRYANGDSSKASKVREEERERVVAAVREQQRQVGAKTFETQCKFFPQIVSRPEMDIDKRFASELADLREHPAR
jgi:hypothetical protein